MNTTEKQYSGFVIARKAYKVFLASLTRSPDGELQVNKEDYDTFRKALKKEEE